jgi:hypothetical protein
MTANPLLQNLIAPGAQVGAFVPVEGGRLTVVLPGEAIKCRCRLSVRILIV